MNQQIITLIYLVAAALFILGLKRLGSPATARSGNKLAMLGMLIAIIMTLLDRQIISFGWILAGLVVGGAIGGWLAKTAEMTAMPQLVALFNGFGGAASAFVAGSEVAFESGLVSYDVATAIVLSALIGTLTLTGSLVAFAKLQGIMDGAPILLPQRHLINAGLAILSLVLLYSFAVGDQEGWLLIVVALAAAALGILLTIPIGGADMPVVISLLNSYSGIAAAMTGFVLNNQALIIGGSLVGASGLILTRIMCKGMNRSLANVLFGGMGTGDAAAGAPGAAGTQGTAREMSAEDAALVMENAKLVIIVPGYGMAVAQAQHAVREMAELLEREGVTVKYAVHPVAGRMPGHMNVLLAEANVPYPQLYDLDDINPEFERADVALVIGANDVTNPAARHDTASPIYGMPILNVDKARTVMVLKRSLRPGFAGIENELYFLPNTYMIFGDAKESVTGIIGALKVD